jgi:hypothetical protein
MSVDIERTKGCISEAETLYQQAKIPLDDQVKKIQEEIDNLESGMSDEVENIEREIETLKEKVKSLHRYNFRHPEVSRLEKQKSAIQDQLYKLNRENHEKYEELLDHVGKNVGLSTLVNQWSEHVELIEVPSKGEAVSLVRLKKAPKCAFLIYTEILPGTYYQLRFNYKGLSSRKFTLVCICCYDYISADNDNEMNEKTEEAKTEFIKELYMLCEEKDITSVWARRPPDIPGEILQSGETYRDTVERLYGTEMAPDILTFISPDSQLGN